MLTRQWAQTVMLVLVALIAALAGFALTTGRLPGETAAAARPSVMPAAPHILYLAPEGTSRGIFDADLAQEYGATIAHSANWRTAQAAARRTPLDALLFDASLLGDMTDEDRAWLQSQARDGVVLVGLGTDDWDFGQALGVETLRHRGEGNYVNGPDEYRMVTYLLLADPDDLRAIEQEYNWLEELTNNDDNGPFAAVITNHPMVWSFAEGRDALYTPHNVEMMFWRIATSVEGVYKKRGEYEAYVNSQGAGVDNATAEWSYNLYVGKGGSP